MVVGKPTTPSEGNFFREVILGLGMRATTVASPQDLLLRIIRAIEQEAARASADVVVIAIDTAEQLTLKDYAHLAKLQNHFLGSSVQPFFLFIHQSNSVMGGADDLSQLAPPHLYGRFFVDSHPFTGLLWEIPKEDADAQDACDVALAFRQLDQVMRWPDEGGKTYTEAFAPYAYSIGWRLEKETEAIRERIENLANQGNYPVPKDWLMASFNQFVYHLLTKIAAGRSDFEGLTTQHIDEALLRSAYAGFESSRNRAAGK